MRFSQGAVGGQVQAKKLRIEEKVRREGKPGPFIPSEVLAQTGPAWATTPALARRRRRETRAVGAWAKRPRSGDDVYAWAETLCAPREDACARATTHAPGRQRLRPVRRRVPRGRGVFFTNTPNFNARATTSASVATTPYVRGDNACARATTSALARRRLDPIWAFFFAFAIQTKLFPLSLFENYSNCVEDGNPKLFLLVRVFLSALNRDLAFLSRHLSI